MKDAIIELVRLIEEVSGNVVAERDYPRLERTALGRCRIVGQATLEGYVRFLRYVPADAEWLHLLSAITINESYLFRIPQQFRAFSELAIPELAARRPAHHLRVWSAGCARGEEAATLAILLAESSCLVGWNWRVLASDVDGEALADARRGFYCKRAVAKVAPALLAKYFVSRGDRFELVPSLRERIDYRHQNLMKIPSDLSESTFDVVFLRNVLIYFRAESQQRVADAVAGVLAHDGYLFLGPSESLWQLCSALEPVDLGDCFYYRRTRPSLPPAAKPRVVKPSPPARPAPSPSPSPIRATRPGPAPAPPPSRGQVRSRTFTSIVAAIASERLDHARSLIAEATQSQPEDAILRAFEGLIFDFRQQLEAALRAYRAALYLDPRLFQVRMLLARCMSQIGSHQRAASEYRKVLSALASSDICEVPGAAELGLPSPRQAELQCRQALTSLEDDPAPSPSEPNGDQPRNPE